MNSYLCKVCEDLIDGHRKFISCNVLDTNAAGKTEYEEVTAYLESQGFDYATEADNPAEVLVYPKGGSVE